MRTELIQLMNIPLTNWKGMKYSQVSIWGFEKQTTLKWKFKTKNMKWTYNEKD